MSRNVLVLVVLVTVSTAGPGAALTVQAHLVAPGWNGEDATGCLQGAIGTGADTVVVANMGAAWMVRPVFATHDDQTLIFEDGVVLHAIANEFHGTGDCLLTISGRSNVTVIGYGATLRMRKLDYQDDSRYEPAEWRHCLTIRGGNNISVFGLRLESSGGDGVMVGGANTSHNVLLSDLISDDNHRQGISITNVRHMVVRNSVFMNTWGTLPYCGIDIEPDSPGQVIQDLELLDCAFLHNRRYGVKIALWHVDESTEDISISFCRAYSEAGADPLATNEHSPLEVAFNPESAPRARIAFDGCDFVGPPEGGNVRTSLLRNLHADRQQLRFLDSQWRGSARTPFMVMNNGNIACGSVSWDRCTVNLDVDEPFLWFMNRGGSIGPLSGALTVHSPFEARMDLGGLGRDIGLEVTRVPTRAPEVAILSPQPVPTVMSGSTLRIAAAARDLDAGEADGAGIEQVEFEVRRGARLVAVVADRESPYVYDMETGSLEDGVYMVRARALSAAHGSHATALVPVLVTGGATEVTGPPPAAAMPYPLDGAHDIRRNTRLVWTAPAGAERYEVFLGASPGLGAGDRVSRTGASAFEPARLAEGQTYYWRVDATNSYGVTTGPVWTFTTGQFTRPVAHYTFDEGEGREFADASGNGHSGQIVSGVTWGEGRLGSALVFDGAASWADLGRPLADIDTYGGPAGVSSIAVWLRPTVGDGFRWVVTGVGGLHYIGIRGSDGLARVHCQVKDAANNVNYWPRSEWAIQLGEWVHVVVVLEGGKGYRIYLNGQLNSEEENANLSLYQYEPGPAFLGNDTWSHTSYYQGAMDEMWVYSHALSDAEVLDLYAAGVPTDVAAAPGTQPVAFALESNFPNPFNPSTTIGFAVPEPGPVELTVFDVSGQIVAVLVDQVLQPGRYRKELDGGALASGVYLYRLRQADRTLTRKMLLLR